MKGKSVISVIGENNKITKAISVLSLILIMSGLFAFILIGLYRFGLIEFPAFIQNIFFKTDDGDSEMGKDDKNIYDFLRNKSESDDGGYDFNSGDEAGYALELTLDNIKDIISKTKLPDGMYLEIEANYYDDGKISRTEEMSLWKKGDKYKYILKVNSVLTESYINDSKMELIENFITGGEPLKKAATPAFSFDNIPHVSNINHYLNLLESGKIENFSMRPDNDSNIAHIKYTIPQLNQYELIDISLDTGIVELLICYTMELGDRYYESVTTVKEIHYDGDGQKTSINDSIFEIK